MNSNRVKRNICLVLSIVSFAVAVYPGVETVIGKAPWWSCFCVTIVFACFFKMYRAYNKQVKG